MHAIHELLGPITYHAALGATLACVVWLAGAGLLVAVRARVSPASEDVDLLLAYPLGLLAVVATGFLVLVNLALGAVAFVGLAACCWNGVRRRSLFGKAPGAAGGAALRAAPFVYGYALVCGFLLHGATHDLGSHALGDNATWVSETLGARHDVWRIPDLTVLGDTWSHLETASPIVVGGLSRVVPVDLYLAGTSLLTMFVGTSLAIGFGIVLAGRASLPSHLHAATVGLIGLASIGYTGWIPESPPVALLLPFGFTVYWLIVRRPTLAGLAWIATALAAGLALTKSLAVATPVAGVSLSARNVLRRASARQLAVASVFAAAVVAVAVVAAVVSASWSIDLVHLRFLPYTTIRHARELTHVRRFETLAPLAQLLGIVWFFAVLIRHRRYAPLAVLSVATAPFWLLSGQQFGVGVDCAFVVVAAYLLSKGTEREARDLLGAAVLLGLSAWWFDIAQTRGSFVMSLFLAVGIVCAVRPLPSYPLHALVIAVSCACLALAGQTRLAAVAALGSLVVAQALERYLSQWKRYATVAALVVLAAASGVALAHAENDATANFGIYDNTVYSPLQRDVWRHVSAISGWNTLVFTSQTGDVVNASEGWDYYPAIGDRQIYLAGWASSPLAAHQAELRERLEINAAVLAGRRVPSAVPGAARFNRYLAVIAANARHPRTFRELYQNRLYAIYELPGPS